MRHESGHTWPCIRGSSLLLAGQCSILNVAINFGRKAKSGKNLAYRPFYCSPGPTVVVQLRFLKSKQCLVNTGLGSLTEQYS